MKKLQPTMRLLMLLTVLIGIGLQSISQNTITDYQLKQIRLLENQARIDSLKVIELNKAVDTLKTVISLKDTRLSNCNTIMKLQNDKINLQDTLIGIRNDKIELFGIEKKALKKQIRNRTLIIIGSAILNSVFIIKAIQ